MSRAKVEPALDLTWDQALGWRVRQQLLEGPPAKDAVHTVSALAGVQTQVATSAAQVMTIRGHAAPDLDFLLWEKRSLVKTWAMRGTLHLLPAKELGTWFAALAQRPWKITAGWEEYHGVSKRQVDTITRTIPAVLTDQPMTREELAAAIVARARDPTIEATLKSGWSQVLKPAANQGLLAQGPPRGKNVTFVDPVAWVGAYPDIDPESAMKELVTRFLDANGPASTDDFARWLGVDSKTGRDLMTPSLDTLAPVSVEGLVGWLTARGAAAVVDAGPSTGMMLLPGFDPYTLAPISHRSRIIPSGKVDQVSRKAGWISPVILDKGRIVGIWEAAAGTVTLSPFGKLARSQLSALRDHVAERYHGQLGDNPELVVIG